MPRSLTISPRAKASGRTLAGPVTPFYISLATAGGNNDATSYSTASITPTSGRLVLAWFFSIAATSAVIPTATGNGLTWVQVATIDDAGNDTGNRRLTLFRAMGQLPTAGAITFDCGAQTQIGAAWSIIEYEGVDRSGTNGSGAIVQATTNFSASNVATLTVTLGAFSHVQNATVGAFGIPLNQAGLPDPGVGFVETGQRNQASPNLALLSEFRQDNDTTVDSTWTGFPTPATGIAVEIAHAPSRTLAVNRTRAT